MGYGERKSGSGLPTRLSFSEGNDLQKIVNEICVNSTYSTITHQDEKPDEEDKGGKEVDSPDNSTDEIESGGSETSTSDHVPSDLDKNEAQKREADTSPGDSKESKTSKIVNVDININFDLSEIDSAELEAKLELLDEYVS